jgi:phage shock protein A
VLGSKTSRRGPLLRSRAARRSATEAAEAIAILEAERDASLTARALFTAEITKLKGHVLQQQMRFSQLERGRRIARAAEAVRVARRGRIEGAPIFAGTLAEAEATLDRLRGHQVEADAAEAALEGLNIATGPIAIAEKLSAEGFGPRSKPNAADVLARLKGRAAGGKPNANA